MIINEKELRVVVKNLLLQEKLKLKYKGAPKYIEKILGLDGQRWAFSSDKSSSRSSSGTMIDPADFDVKKTYENAISEFQVSDIAKDTLMLMAVFGSQINRSSLDTSKIQSSFDESLNMLEKRVDDAAIVSTLGTLENSMQALNTIMKSLNLGLSSSNIDSLKKYFTENYEKGDVNSEATAFLEKTKREVLDYLPSRILLMKPDIEAIAAQKDALGQPLLSQSALDRFDNLVQKIERLS
tara:strand:+ start:148 stop:864 length:717 start_codon:yes stop_codon:yes gene_type:complete